MHISDMVQKSRALCRICVQYSRLPDMLEANSASPGLTTQIAASVLGLHCLPMFLKKGSKAEIGQDVIL